MVYVFGKEVLPKRIYEKRLSEHREKVKEKCPNIHYLWTAPRDKLAEEYYKEERQQKALYNG